MAEPAPSSAALKQQTRLLRKSLNSTPAMRHSLRAVFGVSIPLCVVATYLAVAESQNWPSIPAPEHLPASLAWVAEQPLRSFVLLCVVGVAGIVACVATVVMAVVQSWLGCESCRTRTVALAYCIECGLGDPAGLMRRVVAGQAGLSVTQQNEARGFLARLRPDESEGDEKTVIKDKEHHVLLGTAITQRVKPAPSPATLTTKRRARLIFAVGLPAYMLMAMSSAATSDDDLEVWTWIRIASMVVMYATIGAHFYLITKCKCGRCTTKGQYAAFCGMCGAREPLAWAKQGENVDEEA